MGDLIDRQVAISVIAKWMLEYGGEGEERERNALKQAAEEIKELPSAQQDYQEVLGWLLAYHTKSFDLHGRYLPHEVISWLINDFTKKFIAERGQNG